MLIHVSIPIATHLHTRHVGPIVATGEHSAVVLGRSRDFSVASLCMLWCASACSPTSKATHSLTAELPTRERQHYPTAPRSSPFRWGKSNHREHLAGCSSPARKGKVVERDSRRSIARLNLSHGSVLAATGRSASHHAFHSNFFDTCRGRRQEFVGFCIHEQDICQTAMLSHTHFGSWGGRKLALTRCGF